VTLARLTTRERIGTSTSDGRAELYQAHKAAFEPMTELPEERHGIVRTDGLMEDAIRSIVAMPGLRVPDPLFTLPESAQHWPTTDWSGSP
jgi:hypothetical protein